MRTSSRRVVVVLFDEVELLDVAAVVSVLSSAGRQWNFRPFKIVTAATKTGLVPTRSQVKLEAAEALEGAAASELVVIPGGYGARKAADDGALVARVAAMAPAEFLAIGNGALVLAKAGLLADRDVAARGDTARLVAELEPTARVDETTPFCDSRGTVTAATSLAAVDAALLFVERALGKKQASQLAVALGASYTSAAADVALLEPK
jgi:transcriptional regulator GlxA family with amidase domain